jgi:hypothetical protein
MLYQAGQPLPRFCADVAWDAAMMLGASAALPTYLNTRMQQGFDTIFFTVRPTIPQSRIDRVLDELDKRGMRAIVCPALFDWDDQLGDTYPDGRLCQGWPASRSRDLGQMYGEMFKNRTNILCWMAMAFDATAGGSLIKPSDVYAIAEGLRDADKNHLITLGPRMKRTTLSYYPLSDCHQLALYASYSQYTVDAMAAGMNAVADTGAPFFDSEGPCFNLGNHTPEQIAGAAKSAQHWPVAGLCYIDRFTFAFPSGWQAQLNNAGVKAFVRAAGK